MYTGETKINILVISKNNGRIINWYHLTTQLIKPRENRVGRTRVGKMGIGEMGQIKGEIGAGEKRMCETGQTIVEMGVGERGID